MPTVRQLLPSVALLLIAGAVPIHAMTVTSSTAPPAGPFVLASNVAGDVGSYTCSRGTGSDSQIGQTFRLSKSVELDRITVRVRPQTAVAGTLVILYVGTFADEEDVTMDALLAAEIRALPQNLPIGALSYLTFDISNLHLDANRQYGWVLGFSGGDHPGPVDLDILHVGADSYAGGQAIQWSGLQQSALPNDLVFFLEGVQEDQPPTLSLLGGRFAVDVLWDTGDQQGFGTPVALTNEVGTFWFFNSANVELIVKVHDACVDPYQRYWAFLAGLTNVGVDLRVRDLVAGFEHTYHTDPDEVFPTVLDTSTFATCD